MLFLPRNQRAHQNGGTVHRFPVDFHVQVNLLLAIRLGQCSSYTDHSYVLQSLCPKCFVLIRFRSKIHENSWKCQHVFYGFLGTR